MSKEEDSLYRKKELPIIVLLDILVLLIFYYMAMPHKNREMIFDIDFSNGVMENSVLEIQNKSGNAKQYLIQHGKLQDKPAQQTISSWFGGFDCKVGSACSKWLSIEKRDESQKYVIIFSDEKVMMPAIALWHNFCETINCDGGIYINAFTGDSSLCDESGYLNHYDRDRKKLLQSQQRCKENKV